MLPELTDDEINEITARVMHQLGIACPSPSTAADLLRVIESIDANALKVAGKKAEESLEYYREALDFIVGVCIHQQKLVIARHDQLVTAAQAGKEAPDA